MGHCEAIPEQWRSKEFPQAPHFPPQCSEISQLKRCIMSPDLQGYTHLNLDDCWAEYTRSASGNLVPDASKFTTPMAQLVSDVHGMGQCLWHMRALVSTMPPCLPWLDWYVGPVTKVLGPKHISNPDFAEFTKSDRPHMCQGILGRYVQPPIQNHSSRARNQVKSFESDRPRPPCHTLF